LRRAILIVILLAGVFFAVRLWRGRASTGPGSESPVTVDKQPATFANRTFDPARPPVDMPPLSREDEAECDSNFICNARVRGETQKIDATHAVVTIKQVNVALQLNVTIWAPGDATQKQLEHEDGHRQISLYYYRTADGLAQEIASARIGDQIEISGTDLNVEANKALQQVATDVDAEFNRRLDPGPTQFYYDTMTDHGRNGTVVKDAIAAALRDNGLPPIQSAANPGN
jgi:hypothetical protein